MYLPDNPLLLAAISVSAVCALSWVLSIVLLDRYSSAIYKIKVLKSEIRLLVTASSDVRASFEGVPCTDGNPDPDRTLETRQLQCTVDELTRLLCIASKALVANSIAEPEVDAWRLQHAEQDRLRLAKEAAEESAARERRRAMLRSEIKALEAKQREFHDELANLTD